MEIMDIGIIMAASLGLIGVILAIAYLVELGQKKK